jgi:predicted protein tyrosine phosphatase
MKVLYVFADNPEEWNCSQWRCTNPANAINVYKQLNGTEDEAKIVAFQDFVERRPEANEMMKWADVIVLERLVIGNTIPRMLECLGLGKILIGDVDDAYHYMSTSISAYKFWHEGLVTVPDEQGQPRQIRMSVPPIEQITWGMKYVHAITSPSSKLLQDWSTYHRDTILSPNYLPTAMYLPSRRPVSHTPQEREKRFVIGWGGSWSHFESWTKSGIIEALKTIAKKYPQVIVRVAGGDPRLVDAIGIPGKVYSSGWTPMEKWPPMLADYDLGLIPLTGPYDDRRSWIKALEYTLMGIPWVGSKMIPTEEFADYGTRIKNIPTAWVKAIEDIILNYDVAKAKVDAGMELAMSKDIVKNVPNILGMYQSIINKAKESTK